MISLRQHLIGMLVVLVFLFGPVAIRIATGGEEINVSLLTLLVTVMIAAPWGLTIGLRLGDRHKLSLARTILVSYGLAAITGGVLAVIWQLVTEFEPGASVVAQGLQGAYAGTAMVGAWGMFTVMPNAIRAERERAELHREAERTRVRAALEPHFVLNTLNAIGGLIGDDPETARRLVGHLGDLLRDVVHLAEQEQQPVATEVAWLQRYTRILEVRHAGRLAVEWEIDPAAGAVRVPVLLLQPLVENAIQHGALQRPGGGRVRVTIRLADRLHTAFGGAARPAKGELRCTIEDDGPGMATEQGAGGKGLALTRRRLAVDAPGSTLELVSTPAGTRAIVHLAIDAAAPAAIPEAA